MGNKKDSQKEPQDTSSVADGKAEQNVSDKTSTKEKSAKPRHRASVACASCRDRRIRVSQPFDLEYQSLRRVVCGSRWTNRVYAM